MLTKYSRYMRAAMSLNEDIVLSKMNPADNASRGLGANKNQSPLSGL